MVLARKLCRGLSVAKSSMESTPRTRLEGTPTAAAQSVSPASSPELILFSPGSCLLSWVPHGEGSRVTSTQIGLSSLSCPHLFPLCGNSGPQTYVISPCVSQCTLCPAFDLEMRGLVTVHVPASGQKTDVDCGWFSRRTSVKVDSCLKVKGEQHRGRKMIFWVIRRRLRTPVLSHEGHVVCS